MRVGHFSRSAFGAALFISYCLFFYSYCLAHISFSRFKIDSSGASAWDASLGHGWPAEPLRICPLCFWFFVFRLCLPAGRKGSLCEAVHFALSLFPVQNSLNPKSLLPATETPWTLQTHHGLFRYCLLPQQHLIFTLGHFHIFVFIMSPLRGSVVLVCVGFYNNVSPSGFEQLSAAHHHIITEIPNQKN